MPSLKTSQLPAIDRLSTRKSTILVAPTGAGKTVICLSAVKRVIDVNKIKCVIVACPAKVVSVWPKEVKKWDHLKGLKVIALTGDPAQREKALKQNADVWVISLNNLDWLLDQKHGADGIIIDELSKAAGKQTKGLNTKRRGGCFIWRIGMTATPVSQDYQKIFSMARLADGGKALGTNKAEYLTKYFDSDYMGYNFTLKEGAAERIMKQIKKLVHIIDDTKEADLPKLHHHVIEFDMPRTTRKTYNRMKKDMVVDGVEADAVNAAVRDGKLRQMASGFFYDEDKQTTRLDDARRNAAVDWWIDSGKPRAVLFYEFVAQGDMLKRVFAKHLAPSTEEFMAGKGKVLVAQISALSHGVDGLQDVCSHALMYHPMWSRDATEQAEGRLWRTGATEEVHITTLMCEDTLDALVALRVEDRGEWMKLFKQHLGAK